MKHLVLVGYFMQMPCARSEGGTLVKFVEEPHCCVHINWQPFNTVMTEPTADVGRDRMMGADALDLRSLARRQKVQVCIYASPDFETEPEALRPKIEENGAVMGKTSFPAIGRQENSWRGHRSIVVGCPIAIGNPSGNSNRTPQPNTLQQGAAIFRSSTAQLHEYGKALSSSSSSS